MIVTFTILPLVFCYLYTERGEMDAGTTTFNDQMRENAEKSTGMGGKRFLGWTPNGAEAWISYNFDRASKELSIDSTVKLSLLLEEGAELADCRVSIKRGSTNRTDVNQFGELAAIDRVVLDTPTVSLDFSYLSAS